MPSSSRSEPLSPIPPLSPLSSRIQRRKLSRAVLWTGVAVVGVLMLAMLHYLVDVFLVLFMGVVLGILLEGFANAIRRATKLAHGWSVFIAIVILVAFFAGAGWLVSSRAANEVERLQIVLPQALENLENELRVRPWGKLLLDEFGLGQGAHAAVAKLGPEVTGALWTTFRVLVDTVVVVLIALYIAAEPMLYTAGIELLIPRERRRRAHEILMECASAVRWWMIGQLFAMVVLGILSGVGLWLLGIQLPLALGLITGLFEFVPIAGAWAGAVPPLLLALMTGRLEVLYVILLYLGLHILEGYILTPLIQQRTILVPPALLLASQLVFGVLFGLLGIVVTAPILAVTIPLVRMLYVEDVLNDTAPDLQAYAAAEMKKPSI